MTRALRLDDRMRARDGVDLRNIEGTTVIFSIETGKYFGIEGVGIEIWQALDEGLTLGEVSGRLVRSYEVPVTACQEDVLQFAQSLCDRGLLELSEPDK